MPTGGDGVEKGAYMSGWDELELWLTRSFAGALRKNGREMVMHSLRIGRAIHNAGEPHEVIFGGYCHDVFEDIGCYRSASPLMRRSMIRPVARRILKSAAIAERGVDIVEACTHTDEEYAMPKTMRKAAATARWLSCGDRGVQTVKVFDCRDNLADFDGVPGDAEKDYRAWACPLLDGLEAALAVPPHEVRPAA